MFASTMRFLILTASLVAAWPATASGAGALDLSRLESRLRDTEAFDWMQKMQLSAEVDELRARIEARQELDSSVGLSDLQGRFDQLFDAVLARLREADPGLHKDMLASRDRIWTTLSDPERPSGS